jgi:hypothetical protein
MGLAKSFVESARQAKDNDRQPLAAPAQPSAPVQPQKAPGGDVNKTE